MLDRFSRISFLFLLFLSVSTIGCGGGIEPGVADGADEPEPEMTAEEEAAEAEAARNAMQ
ncbi:MAG: hypothetical protein KDA89_23640 [Planctomycetaceae bacterium]|nr:hypothetical protein [Planctomycetaceae bacterium]